MNITFFVAADSKQFPSTVKLYSWRKSDWERKKNKTGRKKAEKNEKGEGKGERGRDSEAKGKKKKREGNMMMDGEVETCQAVLQVRQQEVVSWVAIPSFLPSSTCVNSLMFWPSPMPCLPACMSSVPSWLRRQSGRGDTVKWCRVVWRRRRKEKELFLVCDGPQVVSLAFLSRHVFLFLCVLFTFAPAWA